MFVLTELEKLSGHFQLLSVLSAATRSSLLQLLKTTMVDREAVSVLESVVSGTYRNRAQTHTHTPNSRDEYLTSNICNIFSLSLSISLSIHTAGSDV